MADWIYEEEQEALEAVETKIQHPVVFKVELATTSNSLNWGPSKFPIHADFEKLVGSRARILDRVGRSGIHPILQE